MALYAMNLEPSMPPESVNAEESKSTASAQPESGRHESPPSADQVAARLAVLNAVILTAISLSLWRAIALGANGIGAGTLIIGAVGLLGIGASRAEKSQKRSLTWDAVSIALAIVATLVLGELGAYYFANQPVDVTSQVRLERMANAQEQQYLVTLGVPRSLDFLRLRMVLVDDDPGTGSCVASTYQVQRLGDLRPEPAVASEGQTGITVPAGVSQLELLVTVNPAPSCEISLYPESAVFVHQ